MDDTNLTFIVTGIVFIAVNLFICGLPLPSP
jgi:hypothetical protein